MWKCYSISIKQIFYRSLLQGSVKIQNILYSFQKIHDLADDKVISIAEAVKRMKVTEEQFRRIMEEELRGRGKV